MLSQGHNLNTSLQHYQRFPFIEEDRKENGEIPKWMGVYVSLHHTDYLKAFRGDEDMGDIVVNHELCDGCAECLSVCDNNVFDLNSEGQSEPVNMDDCEECFSCVKACPNEAISIRKGPVQRLELDSTQQSKEKRIITKGDMETTLFLDKEQLGDFLISLGEQVKAGNNLNLSTDDWELPFKFREPVKLEIEFEGYKDKELEIEFKFKGSSEGKAPKISRNPIKAITKNNGDKV